MTFRNFLKMVCAASAWFLLWGLPMPAHAETGADGKAYIPLISCGPVIKELENGDFEAGETGWTQSSRRGLPLIVKDELPVDPHGGDYLAWLGGANNEMASIQQYAYVHSETPYLVFYYWMYSEEVSGDYDIAKLLVNGAQFLAPEIEDTNKWVRVAIDLSEYAGQTVSIQFRLRTDTTFTTSWMLDDIRFEAASE